MSEIKTRIFNYGDEKESEWPPRFGTGEGGIWHVDRETGKVIDGPPPPREVFDRAPFVIQDTITPYRHPATGQVIESRSKLAMTDKVCGTVTTDKKLTPDSSWQKERQRERRQDLHKAMHKAVAQIDNGTANLSEETREKCRLQNEIVSKALNFDAFNVAGRKDNAEGKKYRRK